MIGVSIQADAMMKWTQYLEEELPKQTNRALASGLNAYGEEVARAKAQALADEYDLSWSEVLDMFEIKEATPRRLVWELDSSAIEGNPDLMGQMGKRDTKGYEAQTLVEVVTSGDGKVCPICEEAEEKSPWAMYELKEFLAQHQNFLQEHPDWAQGPGERSNLLHPNCRCMTKPWASERRVSLTWGKKGAPPELLSARKLGEKVAGEMKVAIRVKL